MDLSLLDLTLSHLLSNQEKRTVFHSSLQAKILLWPSCFQARSLQKFCDFVYCMSTSPVPNSVMVSPVEGSTSPSVFYSDSKLNSQHVVLLYCS